MSDNPSVHTSNKKILNEQVGKEKTKKFYEHDKPAIEDEYDPNWREEFFAKNEGKYSFD
jgi:hypothetical protein